MINHIYCYRKVKRYYSPEIKSKSFKTYNNIRQNDIFLKEVKGNHILKIRVQNKYPFVRIILKQLIADDLWFGKYPNSDDIIIIKEIDVTESFKVYVIQNQWRYRFLLLDMIYTNPKILSYNKPS